MVGQWNTPSVLVTLPPPVGDTATDMFCPLLAVKVAVITLLLPLPLAAVNVQGLVVPEHVAVPVVLQLLKVYPEFAVAVMVTAVLSPSLHATASARW